MNLVIVSVSLSERLPAIPPSTPPLNVVAVAVFVSVPFGRFSLDTAVALSVDSADTVRVCRHSLLGHVLNLPPWSRVTFIWLILSSTSSFTLNISSPFETRRSHFVDTSTPLLHSTSLLVVGTNNVADVVVVVVVVAVGVVGVKIGARFWCSRKLELVRSRLNS